MLTDARKNAERLFLDMKSKNSKSSQVVKDIMRNNLQTVLEKISELNQASVQQSVSEHMWRAHLSPIAPFGGFTLWNPS